jgi:hypothetical protein
VTFEWGPAEARARAQAQAQAQTGQRARHHAGRRVNYSIVDRRPIAEERRFNQEVIAEERRLNREVLAEILAEVNDDLERSVRSLTVELAELKATLA